MKAITIFERFLDSLDSTGGHILILLTLLVGGTAVGSMELQAASMGALFAVLRTAQSNQARQQNGGTP